MEPDMTEKLPEIHSPSTGRFRHEMRAIAIYCWHHTDISPAKLNQILNCPCESAFQSLWDFFAPQYQLPMRAEAVHQGEMLESSYQQQAQSKIYCAGDAGYPDALYVLQSPPILCVRGQVDVLSKPQVALVGSRTVHPISESMTHQIADHAIKRGFVITSGGALGIDAQAHRRAMAHAHPTVVVSAMGTQLSYPRENQDIFDYAGRYGAIVSQFPNRPVSHKPNFPQRNDIIAALSQATIVVQSRAKGGALYTARAALKLHRPLFVAAMPGFDERTQGGLALVQEGKAKLLCAPEDLDALQRPTEPVQKLLLFSPPPHQPSEPTNQNTRTRILSLLRTQKLTRELLRIHTDMPDDFDETLLDLELAGDVIYAGGNYTLSQVR